jgi:hypothetical protein
MCIYKAQTQNLNNIKRIETNVQRIKLNKGPKEVEALSE